MIWIYDIYSQPVEHRIPALRSPCLIKIGRDQLGILSWDHPNPTEPTSMDFLPKQNMFFVATKFSGFPWFSSIFFSVPREFLGLENIAISYRNQEPLFGISSPVFPCFPISSNLKVIWGDFSGGWLGVTKKYYRNPVHHLYKFTTYIP